MGGGSKYRVVTFKFNRQQSAAYLKGVHMDIEKIEKFIDAGYTKQEIDEMLNGTDTHENESAGAGEHETEEQNEADKAHESALTSDDIAKTIEALTKTVDGLINTVKAMQEANVNNANGGRAGTDTVGEVINSFIKEL